MKLRKTNNFSGDNIIYFAGGCDWGPERFFRFIKGVTSTELGYANCKAKHPDCSRVISDGRNFVETVKITFDPYKVSLNSLLDLFFRTIDPPTENFGGQRSGLHNHSGIFYTNKDQLQIINVILDDVARRNEDSLAIEAVPLQIFYTVADYNQKYTGRNSRRYCQSH